MVPALYFVEAITNPSNLLSIKTIDRRKLRDKKLMTFKAFSLLPLIPQLTRSTESGRSQAIWIRIFLLHTLDILSTMGGERSPF